MQFGALFVTKRRDALRRTMTREIKNENVELLILQRGNQREHIGALRKISVADDHRGSAAQPGEEPPFALAAFHRERDGNRMPHHYVQIEGSRGPNRM